MNYYFLGAAAIMLALIGIETWQYIKREKANPATFNGSGAQLGLFIGFFFIIMFCLASTVLSFKSS